MIQYSFDGSYTALSYLSGFDGKWAYTIGPRMIICWIISDFLGMIW